MALKAGRVGIDPKYVDASGKPIIDEPTPPTPPTPISTDAVEWVTVVDNGKSGSFEMEPMSLVFILYAYNQGYALKSLYWSGVDLYTYYDQASIKSSGSLPGAVTLTRDGNTFTFASTEDVTIKVLMKPKTASVTTKKATKRTTKK